MWLISLRLRARIDPVRTAFFIVGLFAVSMFAPFFILGPLDVTGGTGAFTFDTLTGGIYWQAALAFALLCFVAFLGWWDITRLSSKIDRIGLRALYATLIFPAAGIVTFTLLLIGAESERPASQILLIVLTMNFFVGFAEEILFRGILFGALRQKKRLITAIIVSSVSFGLLHLVNAGVGQSLPDTLFQMLNATALGVLFCGLVLQGNSLWPAIILHMIWNAYAMMGVASTETMVNAPSNAVASPALTLGSLMLPAVIGFIAIGVIYNYRHRTGVRLRDVVPIKN